MKYESLSLQLMIPLTKTYINQDVFFLLLTISFLLIAVLKANYWKHTKLLLAGVFAQRYANKFLREENVFTERVNFITFFLMTINFSAILIKLSPVTSLFEISLLILATTLFYLLKIVFMRIVGNIFMFRELTKLGIFFSFLFDRALGVFLFPLVVILYFFSLEITPLVLILIFIVFTIILMLKLFWLWKIGTKAFGLSHFYIFLYLCTLEIFPLLLLGKGVFY